FISMVGVSCPPLQSTLHEKFLQKFNGSFYNHFFGNPLASRTSSKYWSPRTTSNSSPRELTISSISLGPIDHASIPIATNNGDSPSQSAVSLAMTSWACPTLLADKRIDCGNFPFRIVVSE